MSSLGVFFTGCSTFLQIMNDIGVDKKQQHYMIKKMINLAIEWHIFPYLNVFCFVFLFV